MPPRVRPETAVVSLAAIRELDIGRVEVLLLERKQIFTLSPAAAGSLPVLRDEHFDQLVALLLASAAEGRPVRITFTTEQGDEIEDVRLL